jgi:hypothetical protein
MILLTILVDMQDFSSLRFPMHESGSFQDKKKSLIFSEQQKLWLSSNSFLIFLILPFWYVLIISSVFSHETFLVYILSLGLPQ